MKWMGAVLLAVAVVGLGLAVAGRAEDDPPAAEPTEEQPLRPEADRETVDEARIRELVADLGAEDYDRREAAFRELARLGEAAAPALEEAARSEDLQVRVVLGQDRVQAAPDVLLLVAGRDQHADQRGRLGAGLRAPGLEPAGGVRARQGALDQRQQPEDGQRPDDEVQDRGHVPTSAAEGASPRSSGPPLPRRASMRSWL